MRQRHDIRGFVVIAGFDKDIRLPTSSENSTVISAFYFYAARVITFYLRLCEVWM